MFDISDDEPRASRLMRAADTARNIGTKVDKVQDVGRKGVQRASGFYGMLMLGLVLPQTAFLTLLSLFKFQPLGIVLFGALTWGAWMGFQHCRAKAFG